MASVYTKSQKAKLKARLRELYAINSVAAVTKTLNEEGFKNSKGEPLNLHTVRALARSFRLQKYIKPSYYRGGKPKPRLAVVKNAVAAPVASSQITFGPLATAPTDGQKTERKAMADIVKTASFLSADEKIDFLHRLATA